MGNAFYEIRRNGLMIEAGYGVEAECERTGCTERIDRGLAYLCGEMPGGTEHACGGYFCHGHLYTAPDGHDGSMCGMCLLADALPEQLLEDAATAAAGALQEGAGPQTLAVHVIAAVLPHLAQQALQTAATGPDTPVKEAAYTAGHTDAALHLADRLLADLPPTTAPAPAL
ncbi:hypothetical protein [Streptomyces sp. NPDC058674]|uniref:hypothetical protein n=1 Tax=Streptomyces sp. NPDC058674 TaxID=3346592 RepID=UPI0036529D2E